MSAAGMGQAWHVLPPACRKAPHVNAVEAMHGRAERRGWAMGRAAAHPTCRRLPASLRGQVLGTVFAINVAAALVARRPGSPGWWASRRWCAPSTSPPMRA